MDSNRRRIHLVLLSMLALCSCASVLRAAPPAVTEEQASSLARRIEASIARGDASVLQRLIDQPALADATITGLSPSADIVASLRTDKAVIGPFTAVLAKQAAAGGTFRLLRVRMVGAEPRPIFRLLSDQGLNYHELRLTPGPAGEARIADIYVYVTGELLSQTLRRALLPLLAEQNKGLIAKLVGSESEYVKHLQDILRLQQQAAAGNAAEVLRIYDTLPPEVQKDKTIMLLRVTSSFKAAPDKYLATIQKYEKLFPGDPSVLLVSIDGLYLEKKYDELATTLDQIDKKVGGDPYLNLFRANAKIAMGDLPTAKRLIGAIVGAEPALRQPWFVAVNLSLLQKDFVETARLLTESEKKAGLQWTGLKTTPAFAEFLKSKEYAKWAASQNQPAQEPPTTAPQ